MCNFDNYLISGQMTKCIVDVFKIINVNQQYNTICAGLQFL